MHSTLAAERQPVPQQSNRIVIEMIAIMLVTIGGMFLVPSAKTLFALIPIAYLLIERQLRQRTWAAIGFRYGSFAADLRANWVWFLLVGVVSQPLAVVLARVFLPEFFTHVRERLPIDASSLLLYLPVMALAVFGEEMTYRALVQGRLQPIIGKQGALLIAAGTFALVHFAPGLPAIVAFDLGTIFIDAVLFGLIYQRSGNLNLTWAAHALGNTLGLLCLVLL